MNQADPTPHSILSMAQHILAERGKQRDQPGGERSIPAVVGAFNALTGHALTEQQGWLFMSLVKIKRSQTGSPDIDHYVDGAAYFALAGEAALASGFALDDQGNLTTPNGTHNIADVPADLCPVCAGLGYENRVSSTLCRTCTGTGAL